MNCISIQFNFILSSDPKICCQFDFLRLPGGRATCPWGASPRSITPTNVAERARLLLDQYKKKAQLYKATFNITDTG